MPRNPYPSFRGLLRKPPTLRQSIWFFVILFSGLAVVVLLQDVGYWPESWTLSPGAVP